MASPVFIGDEVTAAGYRLAGARTLTPRHSTLARTFATTLDDAQLIFITAAFAAELPDGLLDDAVRAADPLVLVVPDAANRVAPPDLDAQVARTLGIEP